MKRFNQPLLRLEGVTKVFLTDNVETPALNCATTCDRLNFSPCQFTRTLERLKCGIENPSIASWPEWIGCVNGPLN